MDLFATLKKDHVQVKKVLEQLEESGEKKRLAAREKLERLLVPHMRGEEQAFYPLLVETTEGCDVANEAMEEHKAAELVFNDLASITPDDSRWAGYAKVLRELVTHHIKEEEGDVFDTAKEVFDEEQLDAIGARFLAVKEQYLAHAPV